MSIAAASSAATVVSPCRSCGDRANPPGPSPQTVATGAALARSPIAGTEWFVVERLLSDAIVSALAVEAFGAHLRATEHRVGRPDDEDHGARGRPARWLESADGGPLLQACYTSPSLLAHLARLTHVVWRPSGANATFSYYRRAGHHLDLHRDVEECDLAVITCLHRSNRLRGGDPPCLELFPGAAHLTISQIRRRHGERGDLEPVLVDLEAGSSLVVLGGHVAHRLPPLEDGQLRIVAPMCYQAVGPA